MSRKSTLLGIATALACCSHALTAVAQFEPTEQVRIVEENGIRYRETRTVTRRPVTDVRNGPRQVTIQRPETVTRLQQTSRIVQVPIAAQQVVTQRYWWNPWRWGHPETRVEPTTIWRPQVQYSWVPTSTVQWAPSTVTVQSAERVLRFEEDEQVNRVALGSVEKPAEIAQLVPASSTSTRTSGLPRFDSDPPRQPAPVTDLVPTFLR